jgi:hypothetical protein
MIVISNNASKFISIPKTAIVRINLAWVKTTTQALNLIKKINQPIYLDYPLNRTKHPQTKISLKEAISIARKAKNIAYFSFSNAEDCNIIDLIKASIPNSIKLVPKIESLKGIQELEKIVKSASTNLIMVDREDLRAGLDSEVRFLKAISMLEKKCRKLKVDRLELEGVLFSNRRNF